MPQVKGTFNVFRSYDQRRGVWNQDIISTGDNTPSGKILTVQPVLYWYDYSSGPPWPRKEFNLYDVYSFFGRETTFELFASQWIDEFKSKKKVELNALGLDFYLNDQVSTDVLSREFTESVRYTVKSFSSKLMKEKSTLILLGV
jgi:hypothetical protein